MITEHVVSILESLANGVDPTTDTELPHPLFQSPDVIRALFAAAAILQASNRPAKPQRHASAGARWTETEDVQICSEYEQGMTFSEMARRHERSTGAIMSRLMKLGRIDPDTLAPRPRPQMPAAVQ